MNRFAISDWEKTDWSAVRGFSSPVVRRAIDSMYAPVIFHASRVGYAGLSFKNPAHALARVWASSAFNSAPRFFQLLTRSFHAPTASQSGRSLRVASNAFRARLLGKGPDEGKKAACEEAQVTGRLGDVVGDGFGDLVPALRLASKLIEAVFYTLRAASARRCSARAGRSLDVAISGLSRSSSRREPSSSS